MIGREKNVDWPGRLLGLAGILVGVAACVYVYIQNEARKGEIEAAVAAVPDPSQTAADRTEEANAFNARWNKQLTEDLQNFKQLAKDALEREEKAQAAREKTFHTQLAKIERPDSDWESLVERKVTELQTRLAAPQLRVVQSLKKPISSADARWAMIKNDGAREAQLQRVTFTPRSSFESDSSPVMESDSQNGNQLIIRFTPEHNMATEADRHAVYRRDFEEPEILLGDSYVQVRIEIVNAAHLDWGFSGDLLIEYDDGQTLEVPGVQALFVAGSEDSV